MVQIWLLFPFNKTTSLDEVPLIDTDAEALSNSLGEEAPAVDPNAPNRRALARNVSFGGLPNYMKNSGWSSILAYSSYITGGEHRYGSDSGSLSLTKYQDKSSSSYPVFIMEKDVFPVAILRVIYQQDDGEFSVFEYVYQQVMIASHSSGGSGGEGLLTENVSLQFDSASLTHVSINVASGEIVKRTQGYVDYQKRTGFRQGIQVIPPLKRLCLRVAMNNLDKYDLTTVPKISTLPKRYQELLGYYHRSESEDKKLLVSVVKDPYQKHIFPIAKEVTLPSKKSNLEQIKKHLQSFFKLDYEIDIYTFVSDSVRRITNDAELNKRLLSVTYSQTVYISAQAQAK
eukprot:TRINITY_DN4560_c0_g1_i1.p1 TRINITY_DN4560_c0_g1~~TRINITY_DN4560_c0_g1_i1.p1  ORF type:complete len:343 (-),score=78.94 TRINITY_DN4560_c0_g1_i1:77-1105(-)